jgi:protein-arginine kinase
MSKLTKEAGSNFSILREVGMMTILRYLYMNIEQFGLSWVRFGIKKMQIMDFRQIIWNLSTP